MLLFWGWSSMSSIWEIERFSSLPSEAVSLYPVALAFTPHYTSENKYYCNWYEHWSLC